ncbi:MAG: hypothetical protein RIQ60_2128 [Pseudomonadota bacterium]|jgi:hypothetical protein
MSALPATASTPLALPASARAGLQAVLALAQLLERIEHAPSAPDAAQYRTVVERLSRALLADDLPQVALGAVLDRYPGAAEVYENLHYAQAGLMRAALDLSISTETQASRTLADIARRARATPSHRSAA